MFQENVVTVEELKEVAKKVRKLQEEKLFGQKRIAQKKKGKNDVS